MTLLTPAFLPTQTYPFGPGATKVNLRYLLEQIGLQEGVMAAGDLKVSQRAAGGAAMFVDIAPGACWVKGDDTARQGLYHGVNDAVVTVAVPANVSGSPRFDQAICRNYDSSIAGAVDGMSFEVLAGTPNGAATIDNRTGAAALPNGAVRLGEWVTPNGAAAIADAIIRDRRPRAYGASSARLGVAPDYPLGNNVVTEIADLRQRIECSGLPVLVQGWCNLYNNLAPITTHARLHMDGVLIPGTRAQQTLTVANNPQLFQTQAVLTPTPGSHVFCLAGGNNGGGAAAAVSSTTNENPGLRIREQPPNANNGTA